MNPVFRFSLFPGKNEFIEEKNKQKKSGSTSFVSGKRLLRFLVFFSEKNEKTKKFNMLTKTRNISIETLNIFTKNLIF